MAKTRKNEIGLGIKALLSNAEKKRSTSDSSTNLEKSEYRADFDEIAINQIVINPFQPRTTFDEDLIDELAESIKIHGIIQPITVRKLSEKEFQIIAGERRYRASLRAGLTYIPAYIRQTDDQGMLEMAILENIQRTDLNPLEVAISFQRLIDECDLTHDDLAMRIAKKRSSITNYLRLLKLPPSVQRALKDELISFGHAKVLAGLDKVEQQAQLLDQIIRQGWSVRQTEDATKSITGTTASSHKKRPSAHSPEIRNIIEQLREKTGTSVVVKRDQSGKGSIVFSFGNDRDFNDLVESLLGD
jgi:ParB family chromosome partitioning protein